METASVIIALAALINLEQIYTIDDILEKEMLNLRCQFEQSGEAKLKAVLFQSKK